MNVVKDLQSLIQLMHSHNEVIVFPVGGEGQQLLDFLRYADFLNRVCCIAATKVDGNNTAQTFKHEVPVIPFENLVHFRETALLIVSVPEQLNAEIFYHLTRFGFKTLVFVHSAIHEQTGKELQKMYSTGQVMMWYLKHLDKKINEMEYRIAEQNEVSLVNTKAFAEYRNVFRNKEIVIVGCGPTLNYYKPIPNAVHIGLNRAWKRNNIPFNYLFAVDGLADELSDIKIKEGFSRISDKIFIGRYLFRDVYNFGSFSETSFLSEKERCRMYFVENHSLVQPIYPDICNHAIMDFGSVSFNAIHFSLFTYPKRIFLVGCDTSSTGHFYSDSKESDKKSKGDMDSYAKFMKVGYARMKMFAKHYYPNTEIISINPVGLRGLFKDVYTDEYKAVLAENNSMTPNFSGGGGQNKR